MQWVNEVGFKNFSPCEKYVVKQGRDVNQPTETNVRAYTYIVDICNIDDFKNQPNKILVTNVWFDTESLDSVLIEQFPSSSWYGMYAGTPVYNSTLPIKTANCFINRLDILRQSWLYQLIQHDLFYDSYVSFNMDVSRLAGITGVYQDTVTAQEIFENQFLSHLQIFKPEHDIIKNKVPYRNFDDQESLDQIIIQSKFSIILETWPTHNHAITFSEKIFRCLKLPRPWVLFSSKNAVGYLRNLGFDVLDDIVDHSYDFLDFEIDRQVKILSISKELAKLDYTESLVNRLELAAMHNRLLLEKMLKTFFLDVDKTFKQVESKIKNLS